MKMRHHFLLASVLILIACSPSKNESATATLSVKLITAKREPLAGITILDAKTNCSDQPVFGGTDGQTPVGILPQNFPPTWCNERADNLPVTTNKDGIAELKFSLNPALQPEKMHVTDPGNYNVPMLLIKIHDLPFIASTEINEDHTWVVETTAD